MPEISSDLVDGDEDALEEEAEIDGKNSGHNPLICDAHYEEEVYFKVKEDSLQ